MNAALTVVARLMITAIFLMSAVGNKIPNYSGVVKYMEGEGVPAPQILLAGAIVFLIVGSLSVITGFKARFGAGLLAIFLVAATYYFHDFWNFTGQDQQQQMIQFLKNTGLFGTMLFFMANGTGPASLDNRAKLAAPSTN
ncbi:Inner membrane protein YphA [Caulifigura coniformis]|uniref:Inner membrane protein YphA n=1 Tax=Caulifigura coniformis TaxID=2527983 RepID=A0A517SJU2_9PLAN|nr:DoxX family protein [Caulifigura coniformis]QDT56387.1 Inner membrane protein YphA [Caulifigura coniformis]